MGLLYEIFDSTHSSDSAHPGTSHTVACPSASYTCPSPTLTASTSIANTSSSIAWVLRVNASIDALCQEGVWA